MSWETIEHICISIAVVGAAVTYMYKAFLAAKKPSDSIKGKFESIDQQLDRDNSKIIGFEEELDYISSSVGLLMKSNLAILGHLTTNNNSGQLAKVEEEIQHFLINH